MQTQLSQVTLHPLLPPSPQAYCDVTQDHAFVMAPTEAAAPGILSASAAGPGWTGNSGLE